MESFSFSESVNRSGSRRFVTVPRRPAWPMSELAGWWLGARARATGEELAALLWNLARDRRWVIRGLCERVHGDIWVRALRLLGSPRSTCASDCFSSIKRGSL